MRQVKFRRERYATSQFGLIVKAMLMKTVQFYDTEVSNSLCKEH